MVECRSWRMLNGYTYSTAELVFDRFMSYSGRGETCWTSGSNEWLEHEAHRRDPS